MVNGKKRKFAVLSSVFAFILAIMVIAVNGLLVLSKIIDKIIKDSEPFLYKLKLSPFTTLQDCLNKFAKTSNKTMVYIIISGLVLVGLIMIIISINNFKRPLVINDNIMYKGFSMFLQLIFSVVFVVGAVLSIFDETATFKTVSDYSIINYILYAYIALGGLTFLFTLISLNCKKYKKERVLTKKESIDKRVDMLFNGNHNNYTPGVKYNAVPLYNKKNVRYKNLNVENVEPIVKVIEDKIIRVNQLKDMGIITEAQYNAAIARLINSI